MIRFAVIGTNTITDKFLQAASALPDFKLCAVYSRTLARAQEYAQKNNVSLVFDSLEALANSDQIDAVYIASPNFCHAAQSILRAPRRWPAPTARRLPSSSWPSTATR